MLNRSAGNSLIVPGFDDIMREFNVTVTQSIATLSIYTFALGLGPVLSGPLSETIGRWWVYVIFNLLGGLMTIGVALCHNFVGICILRFLAGFFLSPNMVISVGTLNEIYTPVKRGLPSCFIVSMAFFGPGVG
jgi:MFS family permease